MPTARRIPAAERQFSLVLALVGTRRGLTKADVLASVHGYRQTFDAEGPSSALDRKFERDKEELRELGIDIETLDDPSAPGDNQLVRYRVRDDALRMPTSIRLDPDESTLVSLAAAVWREGALAGESRRAVTKLRARGVDARAASPEIAPRLRAREAAFEPLAAAIDDGEAVAFDYRKPGNARPEPRRVEPLALVRYGGHWLLAAFDLDRGAERRFLLQRIVGAPRRGAPVDPARAAARRGRDVAGEALAELRAHAASQPVVVVADAASDAAVRLEHAAASAHPEGDTVALTLEAADLDLLADELAGYGPELSVRSPAALRDAVSARLRRALAEHAPTSGSGAPRVA